MSETPAVYEPVSISKEEIKKYIAPNATDSELYLFMSIAKAFNLNPAKREIHFVKYGNNPGSVVVGYEAYLKRAERSRKLQGWKVEIGKDELGTKATITIWRKDWSQLFQWTVYQKEVDKGQSTWKLMPLFMLRKVAIGQGFRLAFPEDLGGMPYLAEEVTNSTSESLKPEEKAEEADVPVYPVPPEDKKNKKEDFLGILKRECDRLGADRFYDILRDHGFETAEEITDRAKQIEVYKALAADKAA